MATPHRPALPIVSMPQALSRFFLAARRPLVVAGTHGKTTTSAMSAWVWSACGQDYSAKAALDRLGQLEPVVLVTAFADAGRFATNQ